MSQTVHEFINDYEGFDWDNGEVVIVDQRTGTKAICEREAILTMPGYQLNCVGKLPSYYGEYFRDKKVWSWTHSFKTMLIIL